MDGVWLPVKLHLHMRGEQYSKKMLNLQANQVTWQKIAVTFAL